MKKLLSLLLALCLAFSMVTVAVASVGAAEVGADASTGASTKTVYVGVITYLNLNANSYQVHYWGGADGAKDANLTATGKTAQQAVGSAYWSNGAQTFNMYTATVPADATGFKVHNGNTWFGSTDGNFSTQNTAYVFEYGGNYNAYYSYTQEVVETTAAPTTEAPAVETTAAPVVETTAAPAGDTITVYFTDAQFYGDVNVYYWPNGGEWPGKAATKTEVNDYQQQIYSAEIPADVEGIIFNGNGRQTVDITEGIEDGAWWYTKETTDESGHNYVELVGAPEETTTAPVVETTAAPVVETTAAPAGDTTYYLFGYINGADYGCEADAANMGTYKFVDGTLKATFTEDSYVAVKTEGNANWYMTDGWAGEVTTVTLYNTSVTSENSNKLFVPGGVEVTFTLTEGANDTLTLSYTTGEPEETTEAPAEDTTAAPAEETTAAPSGDTITVYFTDAQFYGDVNVYYWPNGGEWPGKAATKTEVNDYQQQIYSAEIPADVEGIIFNGNGKQTVDITEGIADGAWWYSVEETDDQGHNYVNLVGAPEETTAAPVEDTTAAPVVETTAAPAGDTTYYLFGYINGADYGCEADAANMGTYKFVDGTLKATFTEDSYVAVKTEGNANWYMTDGWAGEVTTVTLYNTSVTSENSDKLFVPGGVEVTFTLTEGANDTLTLSYTTGEPEETTEAPAEDTTAAPAEDTTAAPSGDTITVYFTDAQFYGDVNVYYWPNGGEWPGAAATKTETNDFGQQIYSAVIPADVEGIIFNGNGRQTVDITEGIADGAWWYSVEETDDQGHNYVNLVGAPEETTAAPVEDTTAAPVEDTTAEPSGDTTYYLFGYINGADYACEDDADNMGTYKFVNGTLTATFTETSYVAVKTEGNANWYMTDGWAGEVTTVTLYNTSVTGVNSDKLMVPGGVEVTFTLTEGADDTLTLSYTTAASEDTTAAPVEDTTAEPSGDTITVYFTDAQYYGDVNVYYWPNGGEWPGAAATKTETNDFGQQIYSAVIPADVEGIIFNGNGRQTVDITEGIADGAWWYSVEETDDQGHNYVNLVGAPEETTAAPVEDTTAAPVEDTTAAPVEDTTAEPSGDTITVYFTDAQYYGDVNVYYWPNGGEWPGTAATKTETNDFGQQIYSAVIPADVEGIIFNGNGRQTVDITEGIEDGAWWYTKDTTDESGHNYVELVGAPEETTAAPVEDTTAAPVEDTTAEPSGDTTYYLFGYINGADYACEADADNMGTYKFVDGTLKATFTQDSYVGVKTEGNANWYMTDGWAGEVTTVTLYNTSVTGVNSDKLFVPGGVEVTFTLTEGADDTLTLSYTTAASEDTTAAPVEDTTAAPVEDTTAEPSGDTITVYFTDAQYYGDVNVYYWPNGGEWPGTAATKTETNDFGQQIYSAVIPADVEGIIFNGNGRQTVDITEGIADGAWWYSVEETDDQGHNYVNLVGDVEETTAEPVEDTTAAPAEDTTAEPSGDTTYYLFGYINGADYACEADADNMGTYKFVDGTLKATFTQDSYVGVKTEGNANWYMTDGWAGEVTTVTLYNTSVTGVNSDKLFVPGNVEVTFTLTEGADDTLTLSYTTAAPEETTEAPVEDTTEAPVVETTEAPVGDTITVYFTDAQFYGDVNVYYWPNGGEWPGTAATKTEVNDYQQQIYSAVIPADVEGIIFNGNGRQTVDITEGIADGAWWYSVEETDDQGHNYVKLVGDVEETTAEPVEDTTAAPAEDTTAEPSGDTTYYLFGYINGADYACEADADNMGTYKFVDGTLKATFTQDSYVGVKTEGNANWYMTDGWAGEVTTVTLYNTSVTGVNSDKLFVPGGVEVTFTLTEGADDTLTLSYTTAAPEETTEAPVEDTTAEPTVEPTTEEPTVEPTTEEPTNPEPTTEEPTTEEPSDDTFVVAGDPADIFGTAWDETNEDNLMTAQAGGVFTKDYTVNKAYTDVQLKAVKNGADWYGDETGNNVTFNLTGAGTFTVTATPVDDGYVVSVSGDIVEFVTVFEYDSVFAVGNGEGTWLNDASWDTGFLSNEMTEVADDVWEISFEGVGEGFDRQIKFAIDGKWTHNFGGTYDYDLEGQAQDAVYNGDNITFDTEFESQTVKVQLDLTEFNFSTKTGAKFTITITESGEEPILGDVDGSGTVTIDDATMIQRYLAEFITLTDEQKALADTNKDGKVSIRDVTEIQRYLAEIIDAF